MPSSRRVPEATVARLPVYLRVLSEVAGERVRTISSDLLAERAGVNAAQVRKDLSHLGSYGTRGVGYDVDYLIREINRQLGLAEQHRVAIVGVGNLGRALAAYQGFPVRGFRIVAAFDADPAKVGDRLGDCVVSSITTLERVLAAQRVDVAIITTPASAAQGVVDALVAAGVTSLLNFAPTGVQVPPGVSIRQVDLAVELQILSFYEHQHRAAVPEAG
ncbi:MAG: redox-sensing transcriptional repressor Rex [Acidimicrobiaceae bacterium]|nr:redox-sensing transcriptional repressor Rex [Acidimicrobiaceae bacterium]